MNPEVAISEARLALYEQKPVFSQAVVFSIVIGVLMLSPSIYMLEVYDRVVNSSNVMTLAMLTLLLALAYAVLECLQWARQGVLRAAAEGFDRALENRVYEAVFRAKLHGSQDLALHGLRDFAAVRNFVGGNLMAGLMDIPMALLLIGVIFWIDTVLGWFGLVSAIIQGGIATLNKHASGPALLRANALSGQAQNFIQTSLKNAEVVQAMGMARGLRRHWLKMQTELLRHQAQASDAAGVYSALSKYVQLVTGSLMLGVGSWLVLSGRFGSDAGMMLMASLLAGRALAPLVQVIVGWRNVAGAREAFARLENLLKKIPAGAEKLSLPAPRGELALEQVSACAPGTNKPVLRGISFGMTPGQLLAVVGPSASGKSSLAHVLVGAWPCVGGTVRLDGADVFAWNKLELGPSVGFLPQDVALFEGTVAQNIARFGVPDRKKIKLAAKLAGVHDYISSLPNAYDTEIGTEGMALSGGQRQRIGLARAVYGHPRLVVLDEPNANLDEAGEKALIRALQVLRAAGVTVVVITHRKNLLAIADLMLLLVEGEAKAFGSPGEVLAALNGSAGSGREAARKAAVRSVGLRVAEGAT
ncbi:ABC transporter ATP-binding protein [Betaproteobacteria bacterium]|nr:ABC transporter ATP-binding protein [Betaproteobacteria bacterium]GHT99705.1 ABC transporter ATP-binding protein [Betaproteobacteria bacterium]GHU23335.1 ABC transporter ATP-binding protein [Betaproteobacteria bacterium]GHU32518.1 ABC transporter ATP-binding protein [Betaproteobacteria bacterium]